MTSAHGMRPAFWGALLCLALACVAAHGAGLEARDATTGQPSSVRAHNNALDVYQASLGHCEDANLKRCRVFSKWTCTRYTADATNIKTGAGVLGRLIIDTVAATTDDIVIYDNTANSGTVLLSLTNMPASSSAGPLVIDFDGAFTVGLSIDVTFTAGSSAVVCSL